METLGERVKKLEDKVTILESSSFGAFKAKEDSGNPYKSKSNKEVVAAGKDNE